MQSVSEIVAAIHSLPNREQEQIRRVLEAEKEAKLKLQVERFRKAQKWVSENRGKYPNQWVCLEGDKVIAHGANAVEVDRQARAAGIETPYLEHLVEESDWGGW